MRTMSCHLSCPSCQNKFFKISNMSPPTQKRDIPRPYSSMMRSRKSTSSETSELAHENIQLEAQNKALRSEVQDLLVKNDNLTKAMNLNKERFEEDFSKLQAEIKKNETHLIENSKKCIDQQKKFAEEIKKLKHENETLKKSRTEADRHLTEKLKALESEIKLLKLENDSWKAKSKECEERCFKYKTKLKHAVKIVSEMNYIVTQFKNKPENACGMTQTECIGEKISFQDCSQCGDPRYRKDLNSENMMLSDIFFKPKSFLDSEIDLFAAKSKSRYSSTTGM